MSRLVLVGLPGVGKTSLAHALAERWASEALDTDDILASAVGMSAAQYLREEGEMTFRGRELDALRSALEHTPDAVIATGGGIVCTPDARDALRDELTIWLDCDDEVIVTRLGDLDRPLLDGGARSLSRLRDERAQWYLDVSRARVDTSGPLDDVVAEIAGQVARLTQ